MRKNIGLIFIGLIIILSVILNGGMILSLPAEGYLGGPCEHNDPSPLDPGDCYQNCTVCDSSTDTCVHDPLCPCTPSCIGKTCGPDGCGGNCGTCDDNDNCTNDFCQDEEAGVCGTSPICPTGQTCNSETGECIGKTCAACETYNTLTGQCESRSEGSFCRLKRDSTTEDGVCCNIGPFLKSYLCLDPKSEIGKRCACSGEQCNIVDSDEASCSGKPLTIQKNNIKGNCVLAQLGGLGDSCRLFSETECTCCDNSNSPSITGAVTGKQKSQKCIVKISPPSDEALSCPIPKIKDPFLEDETPEECKNPDLQIPSAIVIRAPDSELPGSEDDSEIKFKNLEKEIKNLLDEKKYNEAEDKALEWYKIYKQNDDGNHCTYMKHILYEIYLTKVQEVAKTPEEKEIEFSKIADFETKNKNCPPTTDADMFRSLEAREKFLLATANLKIRNTGQAKTWYESIADDSAFSDEIRIQGCIGMAQVGQMTRNYAQSLKDLNECAGKIKDNRGLLDYQHQLKIKYMDAIGRLYKAQIGVFEKEYKERDGGMVQGFLQKCNWWITNFDNWWNSLDNIPSKDSLREEAIRKINEKQWALQGMSLLTGMIDKGFDIEKYYSFGTDADFNRHLMIYNSLWETESKQQSMIDVGMGWNQVKNNHKFFKNYEALIDFAIISAPGDIALVAANGDKNLARRFMNIAKARLNVGKTNCKTGIVYLPGDELGLTNIFNDNENAREKFGLPPEQGGYNDHLVGVNQKTFEASLEAINYMLLAPFGGAAVTGLVETSAFGFNFGKIIFIGRDLGKASSLVRNFGNAVIDLDLLLAAGYASKIRQGAQAVKSSVNLAKGTRTVEVLFVNLPSGISSAENLGQAIINNLAFGTETIKGLMGAGNKAIEIAQNSKLGSVSFTRLAVTSNGEVLPQLVIDGDVSEFINGLIQSGKAQSVGVDLIKINGKTVHVLKKGSVNPYYTINLDDANNLDKGFKAFEGLPAACGGSTGATQETFCQIQERLETGLKAGKGDARFTPDEKARIELARELSKNEKLPLPTLEEENALILSHNDPNKISKVWRISEAGKRAGFSEDIIQKRIKLWGDNWVFGDYKRPDLLVITNILNQMRGGGIRFNKGKGGFSLYPTSDSKIRVIWKDEPLYGSEGWLKKHGPKPTVDPQTGEIRTGFYDPDLITSEFAAKILEDYLPCFPSKMKVPVVEDFVGFETIDGVKHYYKYRIAWTEIKRIDKLGGIYELYRGIKTFEVNFGHAQVFQRIGKEIPKDDVIKYILDRMGEGYEFSNPAKPGIEKDLGIVIP